MQPPSQDWIFRTSADGLQDAGFNSEYLKYHYDKSIKHNKGSPFFKLLEELDEIDLNAKRVRFLVETKLLACT